MHVDLDVLDPSAFVAQGVPGEADQPGGLTWAQLAEILRAAIGHGGCIGCSLVIYDPEQDPSGTDAAAIVDFVRRVRPDLASSHPAPGGDSV